MQTRPLPQPISHRDLIERGWTDDELAARVRRGELTRVHRGQYVEGVPSAAEAPLVRALCVAAASERGDVLSHTSAALCHGLPVRRAATGRVHLTRQHGEGSQARAGITIHACTLGEEHVVALGAVCVTSPDRTVVDVARTEPFGWALAAADSAMHRGLVTGDGLRAALLSLGGRAGIPAARRVVAAADGRVESPGESLCRALLLQAGLPRPEPQVELRDAAGFVGRVDFCWPHEMVVLEFDGREKYFANASVGRSPQDVLWAEKRREDRIRALGYRVVRVTWDDVLHHPDRVVAAVRAALSAGRGGHAN